MADVQTIISKLTADNSFNRAANLPGLTLGVPGRQYLGATLMPVRNVPRNMFRDSSITYRTVMANTGTRYSPVVLEKGVAVGSMLVELGEMDIGSTFTAEEYDALVDMLNENRSMDAQAEILRWTASALAAPIQERIEKQRWEAADDAQVVRLGANGYEEPVPYPNPTGHRIAGGSLTDATIDPIEVMLTQTRLLASKGYRVNRCVTSTTVRTRFMAHPKVREVVGGFVLAADGSRSPVGRVTADAVDAYLLSVGLPAIEVYDLSSRHRDGTTVRFKRENAMTFFAETGRSASVALPDEIQNFTNTIGYAAIGRAAGMPTPGIRTLVEYRDKKPVGLYGESYATAAIVISDPEVLSVVNWTL